MTKNLLLFLLVIFIGLGAYYLIHFGHYPVALVNGRPITAQAMNNEYQAAFQYYVRTLAQQKNNTVNINSSNVQKEVRRAALNDLIDKALIDAELKKREGSDFDSVVHDKVSSATADVKNLADAAKLLYGLNVTDFKAIVLIPEAEKELLEGQLFLEQKKLADWLADAEKAAGVTILTPEFVWSDSKVALSK